MGVKIALLFSLTLGNSVFFIPSARAYQQPKKTDKTHSFTFDKNYNVQEEKKQILKSLSDSKSLHVLWWNVFKKGLDHKALNENLLTMMNKPHSVDIMYDPATPCKQKMIFDDRL